MSTQFLSKLSQNYIELLEDDEYYDITIEVGEDPNEILAHIKLPNISPEVFQIILKYIYGGILSLNNQDTLKIFKLLLAADELLLQEVVDYLQKYFIIENKTEWMEQHFELIHRTSFQSNSFLELQQFCTDFMANSPEKIFKSLDFTSLPEKSLVQLIKRDDLQMKEVDVWEHVLKWGLAQNPTLLPDPNIWSDDDFEAMKNTLQHCLSLIRFFSLSSKDFLQRVRPYKKLLNRQLYEDLLNSHMDPDSEPTNNILLPRNIKIDGIIDSKIVNNLNIISTISRRIDKMAINNKFDHLRELYLPYEFKLLLRGSRDGFTPKKFHKLCDNKYNTIAFVKVEGTEEIIGGYNPLKWESSKSWGKSKDSFIFSFKDNNVKDAIICNVRDNDHALFYGISNGPHFGSDIILYSAKGEFSDYDYIRCGRCYYERNIRDTSDNFSMEDYEVFQIIKR
ncbi:hypothetical protein GLOIN_2v1782772 [Rhizophagus clarus]|uniref:TLDc domain-containing protein n=1 Tax=Rhizophagus clarus TaxID=94130 RepID=A0A8H3QY02_9GLOM|nr:hypothetical protein GLOIN_2v1782772 [Rhizophagus clarus]